MERKLSQINIYRSDIGIYSNTEAIEYVIYKSSELDEDGKVLAEVEYLPNGNPRSETYRTYNAQGKLIEKRINHVFEGTSERTVHLYDADGYEVEELQYYDDELYEKIVYTRDAKGNILTQERIDEEGEVVERYEMQYNEESKPISQKFFSGESPDREVILHYNDKGLCIKEEHKYVLDGEEVVEVYKFEYNENGKRVRTETTNAAAEINAYVNVEYDERGNPVKYESETFGFSNSKTIHRIAYDEHNRVLENELYDAVGGYLVSKDTTVYNEDGLVDEEEIYELNMSSSKKTHYRLVYEYEYFGDETSEEGDDEIA